MAAFLRRRLPDRDTVYRVGMWTAGALGALGLVFPATAGAASFFFLAFGVLLFVRARSGQLSVLPLIVAGAAAGLALGAVPYDPVRAVGDGFVALAVVGVIFVLVTAVTGSRPLWSSIRTATGAFAKRVTSRFAERIAAIDRDTWSVVRRCVVAGSIVLAVLIAVAGARTSAGWHIVGAHAGAPIWNAAFLDGALVRDGHVLRDARFIDADGTAPRVGVADSPVLTLLKLVHPGRIDGPRLSNVLSIADVALTLVAAVWFLALLSGSLEGASAAVVVAFVLSPLLLQGRVAAPFDLWPALGAGALLLARRLPVWAYAAAFAAGFFNVAVGYEIVVVVLGLWLAGRVEGARGGLLAVPAAAGALLAAALARVLAPDVSTAPTWWSTNDLAQLVRSTDVRWDAVLGVLAATAIVVGWVWCIRERNGVLRVAFVPLLVAAVLALPPTLGGVPLLAPADVLNRLPLGWPSARMLELVTVFAVVPLAVFVGWLAGKQRPSLRTAQRALTVCIFALIGLGLALPAPPNVLLPDVPTDQVTVEFPVAQADSRDAATFAADLLERGARIGQPVPYLWIDPLVPATRDPDLVIRKLTALRIPAALVLRQDVYSHPADFYAKPTVLSAADVAIPMLDDDPRLTVSILTDESTVYEVVSP